MGPSDAAGVGARSTTTVTESDDAVVRAIDAIRSGRMIIVVDDRSAGDEGDLVCAAEASDAELLDFMRVHANGVINAPMATERADRLQLPPMTALHDGTVESAFTVSVAAREGTGDGSASDHARTLRLLADPATRAEDLVVPGHVVPARTRPGGVLVRASHLEAAVDLCRLAGREPVAALSAVTNEDRSPAKMAALEALARAHAMPIVSVKELIAYRLAREHLVEVVSHSELATRFGTFDVRGYRAKGTEGDVVHVAITLGDVSDGRPVLVRVQSACFSADVLGSLACDCRSAREAALMRIAEEGRGVLLYLRTTQDAVGVCQLQLRRGEAEESEQRAGSRAAQRDYGIGAQILRHLGVSRLRLLTNARHQLASLYGLEIVDHVPLGIGDVERPAQTTAISGERYRELAGSFPTGVTIVTARDPLDGSVRGLTSQTFVGLSTDPPLMMVSLARTSRTVPALLRSRAFVVNFLKAGAEELSDRFASKAEDKFRGLTTIPSSVAGGAPILRDHVVAYAECTIVEVHEGGDHWIFVGRVDGGEMLGGTPLLYYRRTYAPWPET